MVPEATEEAARTPRLSPPAGVAAVPQVTNVMTNFGWEYVWHCHMLEHEENDFMRPVVFTGDPPSAPTGLAASLTPTPVSLTWNGSFPTQPGLRSKGDGCCVYT